MNKITADDLQGLNHKQLVMFALFCARQVEHLTTSEEAKRCVEVTELWLDGKATAEECGKTGAAAGAAADAVSYAAWAAGYAVNAAAVNAADAAVNAADAAAYAGWAVWGARAVSIKDNRQELIKQQHNYLYELKNIDKILEEELLF